MAMAMLQYIREAEEGGQHRHVEQPCRELPVIAINSSVRVRVRVRVFCFSGTWIRVRVRVLFLRNMD
jgi:hypothetical protein